MYSGRFEMDGQKHTIVRLSGKQLWDHFSGLIFWECMAAIVENCKLKRGKRNYVILVQRGFANLFIKTDLLNLPTPHRSGV